MSPLKIFIPPPFKTHKPLVRLLQEPSAGYRGVLFKHLPPGYAFTGFTRVSDIHEADFVVVPQSIKRRTPEWDAYFMKICATAKAAGTPIMVFIGGDQAHRVHVPEADIVFKGTEYGMTQAENEVIATSFVPDLSEEIECLPREKGSEPPTVGFCGYAGFPDWKTKAKYVLKNTFLNALSVIDQHAVVYKRGIYFRRRAMQVLKKNPRVNTRFIIRDSFTGNRKTAQIDPSRARKEYLGNMRDSDFILCPKGDGNYSSRFYEALSLGRIPVLIDTDMVLPFEGGLDYSKFIVRVSYRNLDRLGDIIADFYTKVSPSEFITMQKRAREAYVSWLRYDSYFNRALPLLKGQGIKALR